MLGRSGIKIVAVAVLVLCFSEGSVWGGSSSLPEAHENYLYGDYQASIGKAHKYRKLDYGVYLLGLNYLKLGDYPTARNYFNKVLRQFPSSKFREQAHIKVADTYFLERNFSQAKRFYTEIKTKYPSCNFIPLIYLRLAQISAKQGRWSDKRKYLSQLKENYPQSVEMKFVQLLEGYGDFFTVQVGAFSSPENAATIKKELKKYYSAYIVQDTKGDLTIYKVRVGKFAKRASAEKAYSKLLAEGYPAIIYP